MALGIGASQSSSSLFAQNALRINNLLFSQTSAQLASGRRLISGAIDPSGLAISQGMRAQISGVDQAIYNTQDDINLARTADSNLGTQQNVLNRMRDLAVRASNDATLTDRDRARLDQEYQSLNTQLDQTAESANFNTKQLLSTTNQYGTQAAQVGPDSGQSTGVTINPSTTAAGELNTQGTDLTTGNNARAAIDRIDAALDYTSDQRSNLGVQERRFQHITNDLSGQRINITAANSRIADTDFGATITEQTKSILLSRISMAALSQSNAQGFGVLTLMGAGA